MTNLVKKLEDLHKYMNNNDYNNAISIINDIRNIPGRSAELSDSFLKSLQASFYYKNGDLESSFDLIKSAFNDSGGGDNKINIELQNISIELFYKIFNNFNSNKNFAELSKAQRYINEIKNLYNKPNELNTELPKIEFKLKYEEFNYYMDHKDFNNGLNKINEMKNINSNVRPNEFNDACLINLEAFILSEKLEDYTNAFKKVKQALQLSNSDSTIIRNYQIIGIKYIFEIFKKNNYDECESLIDKEYLQQYFIEDKYKNGCYYIKGVIYFSRKEYEKAFDSLYKALKYFKNNDNKTFENCQGGLIDSGINIHKKFIIDKKFPKAKESFKKVTEIITDIKMLNKYKLGCLLNNLYLDRWEEAYELIESLNIEYLDEEKKKILNKLKVIIINNII